MIDFKDLVALRESIISKRGEMDPNRYRYNRDDMILFESVQGLEMPHEPRRIDITILCICTSGSCQVSIDTRQMELSCNHTLLAFPGQTVQFINSTDDFDSIIFCTGKERYQALLSQTQDIVPLLLYCRHHPIAELTEKETDWGKNYATLLSHLVQTTNNMYKEQMLTSMLLTCMYTMATVYGNQLAGSPLRNCRQEEIFVQFVDLLEKNFRTHREVTFYANQLCVTPKYLSSVIKSVSGRSASNSIDRYVIEEAKRLMRTTRKSVLEVSQELNFPNQSFFGKYFKRMTGLSPYQYRKNNT